MSVASSILIVSSVVYPLQLGWAGTAHAQARAMLLPRTHKLLQLENVIVKWQKPRDHDGRMNLTWSFVQARYDRGNTRNCSRMGPQRPRLGHAAVSVAKYRDIVFRAFAIWENAAPLRFTYTADWWGADIVIGAQVRPRGIAFADVELLRDTSGNALGPIHKAAVCLNTKKQWKTGFDGNLKQYDLTHVLTHEIGHALGLDHPGPSGQLMSWRYDEKALRLQPGDIAGIARLYGRAARVPARNPQASYRVTSKRAE